MVIGEIDAVMPFFPARSGWIIWITHDLWQFFQWVKGKRGAQLKWGKRCL
jgi:hypothetical protein